MKKLLIPLLIIGCTIFAGLLVMTIISNEQIMLTKLSIISSIIYTYVTSILVALTYFVLKATQEQKHQAVRPYLICSDFGVYGNAEKNMRDELNFEIYNLGPGIALNIEISIFGKENHNLIFSSKCARLNVQESQVLGILADIRNEINTIRLNGGNGTRYSPYFPMCVDIEFPIQGFEADILSMTIEIHYSNIYDKRYLSTFDVVLDENEQEDIEIIEKFIEV